MLNNESDLVSVSLNTVSVAQYISEACTVTDVSHPNDFGPAIGAQLTDADKFRILT